MCVRCVLNVGGQVDAKEWKQGRRMEVRRKAASEVVEGNEMKYAVV